MVLHGNFVSPRDARGRLQIVGPDFLVPGSRGKKIGVTGRLPRASVGLRFFAENIQALYFPSVWPGWSCPAGRFPHFFPQKPKKKLDLAVEEPTGPFWRRGDAIARACGLVFPARHGGP